MRVGIAGASHWHAGMHLDAVLHAGAAVAGVWDEDERAASALVRESPGVPVLSSLDALLAGRPDLLVVAGHPAAIPGVVRACLRAGVPIVLEKPAAADTATLAGLAGEAADPGQFVAVPLANRCSPVWDEMRRLRDLGRLGAVSHAAFRIVNGPPSRYRADGVAWLLDPAASGGGALRNLGLHCADAALTVFDGAEPAVAGAQVRASLYREAVEEYAVAVLSVPDGPVVTIEAGYTYASLAAGGDMEWRVSAANAFLCDRGEACSVATLDDGAHRALVPVPPRDRYRRFMADTLARLRQGRPPQVGLGDYVRAMRIIDRIYAAAGSPETVR